MHFSVNNIQVIDGGADITDETVQKTHTVRELTIGIPFVSNIPADVQTFVQPGLSVLANGTRYAIEGKTKPFADSQETTLDVNISDLNVPYYLAYLPKDLLTFAMPSCRLDAKLVIAFVQEVKSGSQTLVVTGDVGLREVAIDDKQGGPVVRLPKLSLGLASVEPLVQKVHLSRIALESPELTVSREKTGITNIETLLPKPAPTEKPPDKAAAAPAKALALDVDEISIAGAKVFFSDLLPRVPFKTTLAPIDVKVQQLSTRKETKGTYSVTFATEAKEQLALEGGMSLAPIAVDGKIDVKAVSLKKYAPYYGDRVLFNIESGNLDLSTRYRYAQGEKEPDITASEAALSISDLRLKRPEEREDVRPRSSVRGERHGDRCHPAAGHHRQRIYPEGLREREAAGQRGGGSPEAHGPAAGGPGRGRSDAWGSTDARGRAEALGRDAEPGDDGPVHGQNRRPGCG